MAFSSENKRSSPLDSSLLFRACEDGDLRLLSEHLDPLSTTDVASVRDEYQATLIHYAARYGQQHVLEYLLDKKHLDVIGLVTENGATCAHDAAVCDQVRTLDYLMRHRHSSKDRRLSMAADFQGNTLLHIGRHAPRTFD
jgi:ankyrin repeat protein